MSVEVKVPQLPESVEDATIAAWHKQEGDAVSRDENLVDLETDKVVLEVPAPADGVMGKIQAAEGDTVTAGQVIGLLEEGAGKSADKSKSAAGERGDDGSSEKDERAGGKAESEPSAAQKGASGGKSAAVLSPAVRRLVDEHDLDPSRIEGTGKDGRLTKGDVLQYLENGESRDDGEAAQPAVERDDGAEAGDKTQSPDVVPPAERRLEQRVPMTRLRARIAERLVEAQRTAAILTTWNEVDLGAVGDLRKRYRDRFEKEYGTRLGYMSFFVKAAVEALKRFPVINASIDGKDVVYHGYFDIGIAVSAPRGLVVPILRDADRMTFAEVEKSVVAFAEKARDGSLTMDDLTGGTFSITNGGVFGSLMSSPILNPPQSAILGMHKIQERPMVVDGEIVARPMMYLALSYDHRLVDGKDAVQFLVAIKELLEDPARLMLQV